MSWELLQEILILLQLFTCYGTNCLRVVYLINRRMRLHMWTVVKVMMPGKYFVTNTNNGNYGVPFTSAKANTCKTLQKTYLQLEEFKNKRIQET